VRLAPRKVKPLPEALEAIAAADVILLGPGSLFTSIIPNLLVSGVAEAIEKSRATKVYIPNLMTQPGETRGFTVSDHVRTIHRNTGRELVQWVIMNNRPIAADVAKRYRAQGAEPVISDLPELERMGLRCVFEDLLEVQAVIRHNSRRLAHLLLSEFIAKPKRRS
jgi:uncharacterized cofD-like protein